MAHSGQVCNIEMSVNLFEAPVLMPKVTTFSIRTNFVAVELPAILRLVLIVMICLLLLI